MDDTFYNIIHDIVAKAHREEKIARQTTAVVIAKQIAEKEQETDLAERQNGILEAGTAAAGLENNAKPLKEIQFETDSAIYQNGIVYLKGNPLDTVEETLCPNCRLPRLLHPGYGEGSRHPDLTKEYCRKRPPVIVPGRDVHGNLFAVEKITKKKKNQSTQDTPGSSPPPAPASGWNPLLQAKLEKVYVPTTKCPNCPRYFLLTKSAQHLDRCLGISTRQSRTRTPLDSNVSTPAPQPAPTRKRARPEGEEEGPIVKKKKEFNMPPKPKGPKPTAPSKLKNGTTPDMLSSSKPSGSTKSTANGKGTKPKA